MALSLDWENRIINVPRADMTLIQSSPSEIREQSLPNLFALLREQEASGIGMLYPPILTYVKAMALGGVTLAPGISMINDYTITFEDGQYAVNLVGANSNVGDRVNVNQVSVRSANSAGLVQTREIEQGMFANGVFVDQENGRTGTAYPAGSSALTAVNNLDDAKFIMWLRGLDKLRIKGNFALVNLDSVVGLTIVGDDFSSSVLTLGVGCITTASKMHNLTLTGTCGGRMDITDCYIHDIVGLCASGGNANIINTMLSGNIQMRSFANQTFNFVNCYGTANNGGPNIDVNGCTANINFSDYSGHLTFEGMTQPGQTLNINIQPGQLTLGPTITQGIITIAGTAKYINSTTEQTGLSIDTTGLLTPETIAHMSFDGMVHIDPVAGTVGVMSPQGTGRHPVNNLADSKTIAVREGLNDLYIKGSLPIGATDSISGYVLRGTGPENTIVTLTDGCSTHRTDFNNMSVSGRQSGETHYHSCDIGSLTNVHCIFNQCRLIGPMAMSQSSTDTTSLFQCYSAEIAGAETVIDLNNSRVNMVFNDFNGKLRFTNLNHASAGVIVVNGIGKVTIDDTCSTGTIKLRGSIERVGNGTGTIVDDDTTAALVWQHVTEGTFTAQEVLRLMAAAMAGKISGAEGSTIAFRDLSDTKNRITATVDTSGNRLSVTKDVI